MNLKQVSALAAIAIAPLTIFVPAANAEDIYLKASIGTTMGVDVEGLELDDGAVFGGAIGTGFGPLRVELGATHIDTGFANLIDADAMDYSATAYLDWNITEKSSLYVGAGLDYIDASATIYGYSVDGSGEGWHYSAGYARRFGESLILEAQYTHTDADLDFEGYGLGVEIDAVTLGARFTL